MTARPRATRADAKARKPIASASVRKQEAGRARRAKLKPAGSLRVLETRVYRGPNYWNYEPAIKLVVDLGVLEEFPSNTIPGFVDGLLDLLPDVGLHSCSTGKAIR